MRHLTKILLITGQIALLLILLVFVTAKSDSFIYDKSIQKQVARALNASVSGTASRSGSESVEGSCYLQSEIEQKETDKKNLEDKVTNLTSEIELIDNQIKDAQEAIAKQDALIDAVKKDLIADDVLEKYKDAIDISTAQLNDRNTIATLADRNASAGKILRAAKPKVDLAKASLTKLETQLATTKKTYNEIELGTRAITDLENSLPPLKAEYAALNLKIEDRRKIDTLAAGVKSADAQIVSAKLDKNTTQATLDKLTEVYDKEKAEYDKAASLYMAKYNDGSSVSILASKLGDIADKIFVITAKLPVQKTELTARYSGMNLNTAKIRLEQVTKNYNEQKEKTQILIDQFAKDSDTYTNVYLPEYATAMSNFRKTYTTDLPIAQLTEVIHKATDILNAALQKNKKILSTISEIQKIRDTYFHEIETYTIQKTDFKRQRVSADSDVNALVHEIGRAHANICPDTKEQDKINGPISSSESAVIISYKNLSDNSGNTLDSVTTISSVNTNPRDQQVDISYGIKELSITFDQEVQMVNQGEVILIPSTGTSATVRARSIGINSNDQHVIQVGNFDHVLEPNTSYTAYANMELVVGIKVVSWNKTWTFTTTGRTGNSR